MLYKTTYNNELLYKYQNKHFLAFFSIYDTSQPKKIILYRELDLPSNLIFSEIDTSEFYQYSSWVKRFLRSNFGINVDK